MLGARLEVRARTNSMMPKAKLVFDSVERCGIYPFTLPLYHPFTPACAVHDREYLAQAKPRKQIDDEFLEMMEEIAADAIGEAAKQLKNESKLYYKLARVFGSVPWTLRKWGIIE